MIKCNACSSIYIGQTGRHMNTRVNKHLSHTIKNLDNGFATYFITKNHNYDGSFRILHQNDKGYRLNTFEAFEIVQALNLRKSITNDQMDLSHPHSLILSLTMYTLKLWIFNFSPDDIYVEKRVSVINLYFVKQIFIYLHIFHQAPTGNSFN